jgi:adenylate kinase family enzyme
MQRHRLILICGLPGSGKTTLARRQGNKAQRQPASNGRLHAFDHPSPR